MRDFSRVRSKAIKRVKPTSNVLRASGHTDYFHDGVDILADVIEWHKILRRSARGIDRITCHILDLVDQQMLVAEPQRASAQQLRAELRSIMNSSRPPPSDSISSDIMRALHEINEEAPSTFKKSDGWLQLGKLEAAEDRKARKSIVMGIPMKRTAQRSEYLKSALSIEIPRSGAEEIPKISVTPREGPPSGLFAEQTGSVVATPPVSTGPSARQARTRTLDSVRSIPDSAVLNPNLQREGSVDRPHEPQDVFQALKTMRPQSALRLTRKRRDVILSQYIRNRDIVRFFSLSARPD